MGLFSRAAPRLDPSTFWGWWADEGRMVTSRAVADGVPAGTIAALGHAVSGVHPDLSWEVAPGELSAHVLVVTAAGNADLRAAARRWLLAAPPSDETWTYSDHRLPRTRPEDVTLESGGGPGVDFASFQVAARMSGTTLDVVVHHPAFADLMANARTQLAFLALDLALGEYDVELWIGEIGTSEAPPLDGFGLTALRSAVADLKSRHVDEDGRPSWALLEGTTDAGPVLASAQVPLHPITAPHLAMHAAVLLPYARRTPEGLPEEDSLDALRRFEDRLGLNLGPDGKVVAHQTTDGQRLLHVYVDEATDALDRVRRAARAWPEGRAQVVARLDPQWQGVAHLRG